MKLLLALLACSALWGESKDATIVRLTEQVRDLTIQQQALNAQLTKSASDLKSVTAKLSQSGIGDATRVASALTCAQDVKRLKADKVALEAVNMRLIEEGKKALFATKNSADQGLEVSTANNILLQAFDARVDKRLGEQTRTQALWGGAMVLLLVGIAAFGFRKLSDKFDEDRSHFAVIHADDEIQAAKVDKVIDLGNHTKEERIQTDKRFKEVIATVKKQGDEQAEVNSAQADINKGKSSESE